MRRAFVNNAHACLKVPPFFSTKFQSSLSLVSVVAPPAGSLKWYISIPGFCVALHWGCGFVRTTIDTLHGQLCPLILNVMEDIVEVLLHAVVLCMNL